VGQRWRWHKKALLMGLPPPVVGLAQQGAGWFIDDSSGLCPPERPIIVIVIVIVIVAVESVDARSGAATAVAVTVTGLSGDHDPFTIEPIDCDIIAVGLWGFQRVGLLRPLSN
jgi:hypothetical protein